MSKIQFSDVPVLNKNFKKSLFKGFDKLINSGQYIQGDEVFKFEKDLKNYTGAKYVTSVASGTDALIISLMAIGVQPGDEVITTPFSWLSSTQSILMIGAIPRFVDIDKNNLLIDENLIESMINKKTKAIMSVSLFGNMNDFNKLKKISKKYNIPLVEDAAQSFGSFNKKFVSCNSADISCTSFFPTKSLGALGDAGAIFTNNYRFYKKACMIKLNGQTKRNRSKILGYNARMDTLQAIFLRIKLKKINSYIESKRKIARIYKNKIEINSNCKIVGLNEIENSCCSSFNILIKKREQLKHQFDKNRIQYTIYYDKPINDQFFIKNLDLTNNDKTPNARSASKEIISLPLNIYLKKKDILKISNIINMVSR